MILLTIGYGMYGEVLLRHHLTTMVIIAMIDMTITTQDHRMGAEEEMIMDTNLLHPPPTHLIDIMKTNVATIATMDGMTMKGGITTITMTEQAVSGDGEDHHLPRDFPSLNFHRR
jgi:hypothetical protein